MKTKISSQARFDRFYKIQSVFFKVRESGQRYFYVNVANAPMMQNVLPWCFSTVIKRRLQDSRQNV